jgi:hypothetical protein
MTNKNSLSYTLQDNHGGTVCESLHNDSRGPTSFTPQASKPTAPFSPPDEKEFPEISIAKDSFSAVTRTSKKQKFAA